MKESRFCKMLFDLTIVLIVFFGFMALVTSVNGGECGDECSIVTIGKVKERIQDRQEQRLECKDDNEHPTFKKFTKKIKVIRKFRDCKFFSRLFRRT